MFSVLNLIIFSSVHTRGWSTQRLSNAAKVDNNGLDAIPFTLDLRLEAFHLVTIEGIGDILKSVLAKISGMSDRKGIRYPANVDSSHDYKLIEMQIFLKMMGIENCTKLNDETADRDRQRHAGIQCA